MTKKRISNDELTAAAAKHGVEVTVTQRPKDSGEAMFFPGIPTTSDERRADLLQDDDGSGVCDED